MAFGNSASYRTCKCLHPRDTPIPTKGALALPGGSHLTAHSPDIQSCPVDSYMPGECKMQEQSEHLDSALVWLSRMLSFTETFLLCDHLALVC